MRKDPVALRLLALGPRYSAWLVVAILPSWFHALLYLDPVAEVGWSALQWLTCAQFEHAVCAFLRQTHPPRLHLPTRHRRPAPSASMATMSMGNRMNQVCTPWHGVIHSPSPTSRWLRPSRPTARSSRRDATVTRSATIFAGVSVAGYELLAHHSNWSVTSVGSPCRTSTDARRSPSDGCVALIS